MGLAYNWHRHYDPTIGRYLQPDPLKVDDGDATVAGVSATAVPGGSDGHGVAKTMGWQEAHDIIMSWPSHRAMLQDGPSVYGYARQNPIGLIDKNGLVVGELSQIPRLDNSCHTSDPSSPLIQRVVVPANDNRLGNWCYGVVHSIGAYGVVSCSYICTSGLAYIGYGSMFQSAPFCPDVSGGM